MARKITDNGYNYSVTGHHNPINTKQNITDHVAGYRPSKAMVAKQRRGLQIDIRITLKQ
jgi:hypothetical protein